MKIAFHTLGCKVNQYETEAMKEQFASAGYEIVNEYDKADVYLINTCSVTGLADRKSRQYIRKMKKKNPQAVVAVTGCYVQVSGDEVAGRRANFVHTTIGVVTNKFIKYKDANLLLNALVQIHNMADLPTKSNYLMERPKISAQNAVAKDVFNKKILIMEPDDSMTLLLNTILNIQGYEPQTFSDIKNAEKFTPAVVILDAGSADELAGIEICKKLIEIAG